MYVQRVLELGVRATLLWNRQNSPLPSLGATCCRRTKTEGTGQADNVSRCDERGGPHPPRILHMHSILMWPHVMVCWI